MVCQLIVYKVPLGEKSYKMVLRYIELGNPKKGVPFWNNYVARGLETDELFYVGY